MPPKAPPTPPASPPFRLNQQDLMKIGKGALIAAAGGIVGYLATQVIPNIDQSTAVGAGLATVGGIVVNALRKWMAGS